MGIRLGILSSLWGRPKLTELFLNRLEHVKEKFDCVFSSHVIEHCSNPCVYFENVKRSLKSKGLMIIDTPDASLCHRKNVQFKHYNTRNPFEHCCMISFLTIKFLCKKYGFSIVDYISQPIYQSFCVVLRKDDDNAFST